MLINEDTSDARYQITAYDADSITVGETIIDHTVIIFPQKLITDWNVQTLADLNEGNLDVIVTQAPEILLIGTGNAPQRLPAALRAYLESHNIGVECMTTPAACRSYMALLSEDRNMAAIIFLGS
jgi:uncharacterized protein